MIFMLRFEIALTMMLKRSFVGNFSTLALLAVLGCSVKADVNELGQESYDIDSSWAVKSDKLADTFGDKQALYDSYMEGCREMAGDRHWACDDSYRIQMNKDQPSSMRNYTRMGFKKIRAPDNVFNLIKSFWEANKDKQHIEWKDITVYHNLWDAPPTISDVQNASLPGGGHRLRESIWQAAKDILEDWTGNYLAPCSIWGIRAYHNNSILAPHVDRNPLVSSAIINVDQDVDEPWPLEVWGHDGKPYNITMEPGDMVLYESHSVIHGRPFPMNGRYYANIFVHYEPIGRKSDTHDIFLDADMLESREEGLPPYIIPGSTWEGDWREKNPNGWDLYSPINPLDAGYHGKMEDLRVLAVMNKTKLFQVDENGWTSVHQAARRGHVDAMRFLLEEGADVDMRTNGGMGQSPLKIAIDNMGEDHPVAQLLREAGGHVFAYGSSEEL